MSGPYPQISRWIIPASVISATLAGVQPAGARGCEAGAFWLGCREECSQVSAVLLPTGKGVSESPYRWRVEPEVFGAAIEWAKPRRLTLLAVVHTHVPGVPPKLSWSDRHFSIQVPGILSVVIGNGGQDRELLDWGWYVYENGDYEHVDSPRLRSQFNFDPNSPVDVHKLSADGVDG